MLIVTGTIEVAAADIERARAAALEMMQETRKEAGCHVYEFSHVIGTGGTFRVYEEWEDLPALQAHFEAPHMAVFRAALGDIGVLSRDVSRFEGGAKTSLG